MIILDKPYVSDFLIDTICKNQIPVLKTSLSKTLFSEKETTLLSDDEAVKLVNNQKIVYTNSENAIAWISKNLSKTELPKQIELFKNKGKFRTLVSKMFPSFYYKKVAYKNLKDIDLDSLPIPFVVKPNVGFFSLGVHIVKTLDEWHTVLEALAIEIQSANAIYPLEVMNATEFIIETFIEGEEYAIDCYFNSEGKPVILNVMEHQFSSNADVSDRLYFTSTTLIKKLKPKILEFLIQLNTLAGLTNFPLHIEIRINKGKIIPIEGNPMRFGGWCTTADLAYHAFGFNPYLYFFEQKEPNWDVIIERQDDSFYSVIILNNATEYSASQIESFDYNKLKNSFEKTLELRKVDYHKFPVFGFLFTKTSKNNFKELATILGSDLKDFIIVRS